MKVLFLAYSFPPANFASTPRTWNIARVLAESGCEVKVVTLKGDAWLRRGPELQHPGIERIEVPARRSWLVPWELKTPRAAGWSIAAGAARRIARAVRVEPHSGWALEAEKAIAHMVPEDVDVVLATGSPFLSFAVARRAAQRLGRPYVIDYRDLWTGNPHSTTMSRNGEEATIVRDAAAVIAVSPSVLSVLDRQFDLRGKGHVLTNGFDEDEMAAVVPVAFDHFAVVYTGQFYPPKRVPDPLFAALGRTTIPDWRFHYAGPQHEYVLRAARSLGLEDRVVCYGHLSRAESLSLTAGASLNVVITTVEPEADDADRGIVTSKIFDILGLRRPMLVIAPPGSDVEAIAGGRAATGFFPGDATAAMAAWIERQARAPEQPEATLQYSWRQRGRTVRAILEEVPRR